jgi:flagellar biosynthesis protein FliR
MQFTLNAAFLEGMMLASVRIVAFLVLAPPFSFSGFPLRFKGMLAVAMSLVVAPKVVATGVSDMDTGPFLLSLVMQVIVGALLGFMVAMVFAAIQSAGNLLDLFAGFQLSQAFDPQMNINGAQLTRLMQMVSIALLFVSGAYQLLIGGLIRTFTALPVTAVLDPSIANKLLPGVGQMFVAAVQIAGPICVVLFLADVGLGLLTKVAPALNAFQLGFPLKILITLVAGGVVFLALPQVVGSLTQDALNLMGAVT